MSQPATGKQPSYIISKEVGETVHAGETLAQVLKPGAVVLIEGALGTGKTHFVKGVARYFGIPEEEVQSPTFSLVHEYSGRSVLYHLDCYRMQRPEEALEIGLEEYLYGNGITLIEWPEKIAPYLPPDCWSVEIRHLKGEKREILIHQNS